MSDALTALLACPRCDGALTTAEAGHRCEGCRVDFPRIGGVPWLFAEPQAALGEWRARFNMLRRQTEHDGKRVTDALARQDLHESTRNRLVAEREALTDHAVRIAGLLAPLELPEPAEKATYLALRTRPPSDQGIATYYQNVHRDWAWGETENAASLTVVRAALAGHEPSRVLVLGSGAGRLAYDLHMQTGAEFTVALDFNPLLVTIANRVTAGEALELYEWPIAPRGPRAVLNRLSAPAPAREGLVHVLGDALRPPFRAGAFDTVLTPWLIDILPERLEHFAARINNLLADGGRWINFGSLAFAGADPEAHYGIAECADVLGASGFSAPVVSETRLAYMCSPASRHGRTEDVVTWSAEKVKRIRRVPRHEALPDWLVRGEAPVPHSDFVQMQAFATRVHAFILSLVDSRRSIRDIAAVLAEQKLMSRDEAESAVRGFFIKVYEDSQRGR